MNITGLKLENFLSYEDEVVEFKSGTHLVIGNNADSDIASSNGSGKSGLFDSIPWALFGNTNRSDVSKDGLGNTSVEVSMLPDNGKDLIKVKRFLNHKSGKNRVELWVNEENVSKHTMKETQMDVSKYVGMSYNHFISSVVIEQGMGTKLTTLTSTKRKNYFSDVIEFDWNMVENSVKKRLSDINGNVYKYNDNKLLVSNSVSEFEGRLQILRSMQTVDINSIEKEISDVNLSITNANDKLSILRKNISNTNSVYSDLNNYYSGNSYVILNDIKRYEQLSDGMCPLCERVYDIDNISKIKNKLSNLVSEKEKLSLVKERMSSLKTEVGSLNNQVESLNRSMQMLEIKLSSLNRDKLEYNNSSHKISKIEDDLSEYVKKLDKVNKDLKIYNEAKDRMESIKNIVQPSGKVRSFVSMWYLSIYNSILKSLGGYLYPENEIYFKIDESLNNMNLVGVNYYNLSGGEKRRIDILVQVAFSEFISKVSDSSMNLLVLDEAFIHMDIASINNILPFLQSYFEDSKNIYVISHDEEIKDMFLSHLIIEKKGGVSNILNQNG